MSQSTHARHDVGVRNLALSRCSKAVVLRNFYDDHARTRFFAKRYDGLKFTKIVEVPPYHYSVVFQHVST